MSEDLAQGIVLTVVGMSVVFVALILVGLLLSVLNRPPWLQKHEPVAPVVKPEEPKQRDGRTLAIIAAAVAAIAGPSSRIRRVQFVRQAAPSAWAAHGRISIQASHRLRKSRR